MNLSLTAATGALKKETPEFSDLPSRGCLPWLLLALAFTQAAALPQFAAAKITRPSTPHALSSNSAQLSLRLRALETARSAGDPVAVVSASRPLIALALRNFAELQLARGLASQSVETYRRSLDFEDVSTTRLDLALAYLAAGHPDQALSEATNVLVAEPQNARAWRVQGRVWIEKASYTQAIESLRRSAALQPSAATERLLRFAHAQTRNKHSSPPSSIRLSLRPELKLTAAELQARSRRLRKILGGAFNDLGTAEARQQQFSLALAHFHEAEQWQSDTPGLMRNIGMAAARTADYPEAARTLRLVVAMDPNDAVARSLLGTALFSTASYEEAVRAFAPLGDTALEQPGLAYAWAESLVKLNRYELAAALLTKLEGRRPQASTMVLVAQAWSEMGNYPRAVTACQRALEADPNLAQAHGIAGLALIHEDQSAEAAAEFRAQLLQDPADSDAEYHLAFVLFQLSQEKEAVQHLRNVLARTPNHPDANYELGKWLLNAGKTAEAIPYLEAAARLKPGLDAVHYQLQSAYRSVGRTMDADREAMTYRALKAKSRNITLPPPPPSPGSQQSQ